MPKLDKKIGMIGGGNMGEAFIGAVLKSGMSEPSDIFVSDISKNRLEILNKTYNINILEDNSRLFSSCDIVILAIKPQQMEAVLSQIAGHKEYRIKDHKLIISIAAGIRIKKIEDILNAPLDELSSANLSIIRVMPNTPALVLAGMAGMSPNPNSSQEDVTVARTILESMGQVIQFEERQLDAVTALSGSGPAYIFYIIESMIEGGIKTGLTYDDASTLTLGTVNGAVKLLEQGDDLPEELRSKVTSPGGTTEAALKVLEKGNVKGNIITAIDAAAARSKELSD